MGYTKATAKGISWITLLRASTRVITILRISVLGRILTPAQFGYFGIAGLILALLEVITETGINVLLVQEKKDLKHFIHSAWVISIFRGFILAFLIFVSAQYIAIFFSSPGAYQTIALMSVVPLIRGFINPAIITYQKDLLFHKEFRLRFILFSVEVLISILVALFTRDATSFVFGLIASAIVEVALSFLLIPLWPKLTFELDKLKYVLHRGWWVTLTGVFSYFADNGDNITVGKFLGSAPLGIYGVAYKFSTLPISEITTVINQVIFPVYARFSDDKERLWKGLVKVTVISSIAAFLLSTAIFFLAKPIVLILMGNQWTAAIPVIQILAVYGFLRSVFGNFPPLFLAVGRQNYAAQVTFVRLFALAISVIPLVLTYGMLGAGYAMLFSIICEIPVMLLFTHKIFKSK